MQERWAVAYEDQMPGEGRYHWLRTQGGEIAIFSSKWEATKWVLKTALLDVCKNEVLYVKLPCSKSC